MDAVKARNQKDEPSITRFTGRDASHKINCLIRPLDPHGRTIFQKGLIIICYELDMEFYGMG
jgi:hypothetical protein